MQPPRGGLARVPPLLTPDIGDGVGGGPAGLHQLDLTGGEGRGEVTSFRDESRRLVLAQISLGEHGHGLVSFEDVSRRASIMAAPGAVGRHAR